VIPRRRAQIYTGELSEITECCARPDAEDPEILSRWEHTVAQYVGTPQAAVVNSGRRGMTLIFKHLGVGPGDEVIVPACTLKDLIPLIQNLGATPVPADIDPATLNVTVEQVARRITPRTKAILVLHAFGLPCPVNRIVELADRHNLPVIEDCAHSLGATLDGRQTGSFGYAGFYSFETCKPVNTWGGGMVVSRDPALSDAIHNQTSGDVVDYAPLHKKISATRTEHLLLGTGLGFPMLFCLASPSLKGAFERLYRRFQGAPPASVRYLAAQAVVGRTKLTLLADRIRRRKQTAETYRRLLRPEIRMPTVAPECEPSWYFLMAALPCSAAAVRRRILWSGIDAAVEDEIADDCAALLKYDDCPAIRDLFPRLIALPMYDDMSEAEVTRVAHAVNKAVGAR
jgi:perosamine synthetase